MIYIDRKWLLLISSRLRNFKQKSSRLWNFSCPICGDSRTNALKARGYIFEYNGRLSYKCHNCGQSASFSYLLKFVDPSNHREYVMEKFQERHKTKPEEIIKWAESQFLNKLGEPTPEVDHLKLLKAIPDLPTEHYARQYIEGRKIPPERMKEMYFTPDFKEYMNQTFPEYDPDGKKLVKNDPRVVMFLTDLKGNLSVVNGRALAAENQIRYIKARVIDGQPDDRKVFGLKRANLAKRYFVVEGEIDSMFLSNCVASGDSSLDLLAKALGGQPTLVYDNQPRNKDIVRQMQEAIKDGHKIVVWPAMFEGYKDINEMILHGWSSKTIEDYMDQNTFKGLVAQLKFDDWRKW